MRISYTGCVRTLLSVSAVVLLAAAAPTRCRAQVLNGNFATGDLTDWTQFVTANGTANADSPADVQMFNVTGGGSQNAAHFNVGQIVFTPGDYEGGGIYQDITLNAGSANFKADFAAFQASDENSQFGDFQMLLDSVVIASDDIGATPPGGLFQGSFNSTYVVPTGGVHQLEFLITRPFLAISQAQSPNNYSPDQYITNIVVTGAQAPSGTPEPGSCALLVAASVTMIGFRRRSKK